MPRASTVSEKIWAQAIHAVTVQKMSLRRAAQLYGVHHMSLHRRVRGRYMTNQPTRFQDGFVLTAEEEEEVLNVLREQFMHERHVSPDDVRYVVRTIASQDGRREIPTDFPLNRWILNFKRVHGLESPPSTPRSASGELYSNRHVYERDAYTAPVYYGSSNGSTPRARSVYSQEHDSTSESESEHHHRATREQDEGVVGERRCQQSSLVPPEVWEKAIDAVETQGMSLRNAAKAYDVHFAALHRRVKKRAMKRAQDPLLENYIPFEDEAGIIRVIHARADLGLLMSFDELVDLINRTAMKYIHLTPNLSRSIVQRFQARVEQAIRHLITDWPLPQIDSLCRKNSDEKVSSPVATVSFHPHFPRPSGQSTPTELNNRFQNARISSEPKAMYAYPAPDQFPRPMYHNEAMPIAVDGPSTPPSTIFHL
ncbi:hypothetical protein Poli38472_004194 [Pythium oligandrum]|uniref:HTH psq-type domain-containing protein n=1 Tax=Pythium oligandrum TaxID=41045 RepID=A0A8K1CMW5_PYTOL|nr:hypothetical protein Poli38472_004194 [Pythium oligandrum]|eukprot:TMW66429.1 hypothetical protein Poli38472_004194 [Pythium oligandrum]